MTCGDKEESALIVNEMASLFVSSQGGAKRKEVAEKLARLDEEQVRVQRDLDQAERTLDDVRRRYGVTDLDEHSFQSVVEQRLNELETQGNTLALDISQTQASIETLAAQAQGPVQVQVEREVEMDQVMLSLAQQLAFQESSLAGALAKFGEDHRVVRQLREYIDAIQQERFRRKAIIAEETRQSNLKNAQDQLGTLERRLEQYEKMREAAVKEKEEMDLARVQYAKGMKIRDERRTMLDSIKGQTEKLKIMYDDPETPKVQLTDLAPEPLEASFPKLLVFVPGGTFLGFLLGIGLAFLIELLNDLVRTPKDVATYLHIPLLGMIPDAEEDEQVEDIEPAFVARQAAFYDIARYPNMISDLVNHGRPSESEVVRIRRKSQNDIDYQRRRQRRQDHRGGQFCDNACRRGQESFADRRQFPATAFAHHFCERARWNPGKHRIEQSAGGTVRFAANDKTQRDGRVNHNRIRTDAGQSGGNTGKRTNAAFNRATTRQL